MRKIVVKRWRLQVGSAVTFPLFGRTYILHKAPSMSHCLMVHERVHAEQIEQMGAWRAARVAVGQRNELYGFLRVWRREWIFGRETAMEREAYEAQRRCEEDGLGWCR